MDCHRYVNPFTGGQHGGDRNFSMPNPREHAKTSKIDRIQKRIHTPNWIHRLQKLSYYIYIFIYNNINDNDNNDSNNDDIVISYMISLF